MALRCIILTQSPTLRLERIGSTLDLCLSMRFGKLRGALQVEDHCPQHVANLLASSIHPWTTEQPLPPRQRQARLDRGFIFVSIVDLIEIIIIS
ncbi:hypothetical protein EZV62_009553 [Acer yangbiense]|uniref:Uncharacterized protein n=1 Tax=Acer yangbiense TaxID=1000413 RepID=A0A5C7I0L8_9ROSI|nr:hypothetical protein EZV62_009553 [Acer yangbiense]